MSNSEKNIIITPFVGDSSNAPQIQFSGADANTNSKSIFLKAYPTSNGTLSFEGTSGQLFSITNDLTGIIFSVNDVSGIPSLDIDASGLVRLAQYSGNVAIGKATANTKLDVNGTITGSIISASVSNGTSPFIILSNTVVANLNADFLEGKHGSYYTDYANTMLSANATYFTGVDNTQNTAITNIQAVNVTQNTSITALQGVDTTQNTNITNLQSWLSTNNSLQSGINSTQNTNITTLQGVDTTQNTAITNMQGVDTTQNTSITTLQGVNTTQNTDISNLQSWLNSNNSLQTGINSTQNTSITNIQAVDVTQNTSITALQGVDTTQNTSITALQGVDTTQNTSITNLQSWLNSNNSLQSGINATQNTDISNLQSWLNSNNSLQSGINATQNTSVTALQGVDVAQNTSITALQGVDVAQNTSITALQGVDTTQNTSISNLQSWLNSNNSLQSGINSTQNTDISNLQSWLNSNNSLQSGINTTQNTSITALQGVDVAQNTSITALQGVDVAQNTSITTLQGVDTTQNTNITNLQSWLSSNNSLQSGINTTQNTDITNLQSWLNANNSLQSSINTTQNTDITNLQSWLNANNSLQSSINATQNTNITALQGVDATQNTNITNVDTKAQAAFNKANLSITLGTTPVYLGGTNTSITNLSSLSTNTISSNTAFILGNIPSIDSTSGSLVVSGGIGVSGNSYIGGDVIVSGNLVINGTTTTINADTLSVEDKNLVLGNTSSPSDTTADGGGLTLKGTTDKTFNWVDATDSWTSSEHVDIASGKVYKIGTTTVLSNSSLGSGIVSSSLTSLGALSSLSITSNTLVSNLNADFLEGKHGSYFTDYANTIVSANATYFTGVDNTQNTNISNLQSWLSSNNSLQTGINTTQNTNITNLQSWLTSNNSLQSSINTTQNTNITNIQAVDVTQNNNITSLYSRVNSAITIGTTPVYLGGTNTTFTGINSLTSNNIISSLNSTLYGNTYFKSANSNTIIVRMLDSGTLTFSGNSGQLFSITDSLTGTLFSVNDISGIPSVEVFDTGNIQLAELYGNVLIGSSTDDTVSKLQVTGNVKSNVFISTVANGTSPIVLNSNTLIANLNADFFDGQHSSYYTGLIDAVSSNVSIINGVNSTQNSSITLLQNTDTTQNTNITALQGVDTTQNTNITNLQSWLSANNSLQSSINTTQNTAITNMQGVDTTQNAAITLLQNTDTTQNTNITALQGVDTTQNTNISNLQSWLSANNSLQSSINATQNTNITNIQAVDVTQNTSISALQGVDTAQNTSITALQGVNSTQNTDISNLQSWLNSNNSLQSGINSTQNTNITALQGVDTTQNTNISNLQSWLSANNSLQSSINATQNTNIIALQGVDITQNTAITNIQAVDVTQNAAITLLQNTDTTQNTNITALQGVNETQNTNISNANTKAQGAFDKANSAITIGTTPVYLGGSNTTILGLSELQVNSINIAELYTSVADPTGFKNRTDSTFSWSKSNLTFYISPTSSSFDIYTVGKKITISNTRSVTVSNTSNVFYTYFSANGNLEYQSGFDLGLISTDKCITSIINLNPSSPNLLLLGDERHGISMDHDTHAYLHLTRGTAFESGLAAGNYIVGGNGNSNTHAQLSLSSGVIRDEDVRIAITDSASPAPYSFQQTLSTIAKIPILYRLGTGTGNWIRDTATNYPVKYSGGTTAQYNLNTGGTWSIPTATSSNYVAMWIVATNDINEPVLAILGQRQDTSLSSAQTNNTPESLDWGTSPFAEYKVLYRLIFRTNSGYTNAVRSSLSHIQDYRYAISGGSTYSANTSDHNVLINRSSTDSHPATAVSTDTTNFNGGLTSSEINVQLALDKIDDYASQLSANDVVIQNVNTTQNTDITALQGVDTTQNTNITNLQSWLSANNSLQSSINATQNTNITNIQAVDATQNASITLLQNTNTTQNTAISNIQGVDLTQNASITLLQNTDTTQNTAITNLQAVNVTQNTDITNLQSWLSANNSLQSSINATQNTSITVLQGVNVTQNTDISNANTKAQAAFDKANTVAAGSVDQYARDTANTASSNTVVLQSVNTNQNTAITLLQNTDTTQNTAITNLQAVNVTQNTDITNLQSWLSSNNSLQTGINTTQNTDITNLQSWLSSNNSLQSNINATQNTDITNLQSWLSSNNSLQTGINATQNTNISNANTKAQGAFDRANSSLLLSGGTLTGQLISTKANDANSGAGQIYLNGANGNRIEFNGNGIAAPSFTTRSVGTKIVIYPYLSGSSVDHAIGLENKCLWISVPDSTDLFKWYAGNTNIMTLSGSGALNAASLSASGIVYGGTGGGDYAFKVGDDCYICDCDVANTLRIEGSQNGNNAYIRFGNIDTNTLGRAGTGPLTYTDAFVASTLTASLTTANTVTATFTTAPGDTNFKLCAINGEPGTTDQIVEATFGLRYNDASPTNVATIDFMRGGSESAGHMAFNVGTTEALRIDSAGNLGIQATVNTGTNVGPVMFIGATGSIRATSSYLQHLNNAYVNSTWKYKTTAAASLIAQDPDGDVIIWMAPSGTAGATITWDNKFAVRNSGAVEFYTPGITQTTDVTDTTLGSELNTAPTTGWTGTGWTADGAGGYTHTSGTTALTKSTLTATATTYYYISYTVTGRTLGTFQIQFGGYTVDNLLSATGVISLYTSTTAAITIIPTTDFNGKISAISIKEVTDSAPTVMSFLDSASNVDMQFRFNAQSNYFFGVNSGNRAIGTNNIGIGTACLNNVVSGTSNIGIGYGSLQSAISGWANIAIGTLALNLEKDGYYNVALGYYAMANALGGKYNVAVGGLACRYTSGDNNTSVGYNTLGSASFTGAGNQAFGYSCGAGITTGNYNSIFGYSAGSNLTTGSYNICIGYDAEVGSATTDRQTNIGGQIYAWDTGAAARVAIGYTTDDGISALRVNGIGDFSSSLSSSDFSTGLLGATQLSFADDVGVKIVLYTNYSIGVESSELRIATNGSTTFKTGGYSGTTRLSVNSNGHTFVGTAALATNATAPFFWVTSSAGAPTGAPTAPYTNAAAIHVDTTNSRLYVRVGSTWKYVALTT